MIPTSQEIELLYPDETLRQYFTKGTEQQIAWFKRSIAAANAFLAQHPRESIVEGKGAPKGIARALQYFKDETFLTLYAFISLDLAGKQEHLVEREHLYTQLLGMALPGLGISVTQPVLELEKQISAPSGYSKVLTDTFIAEPDACHPVWYLRATGAGNASLEGSTHTDAMLSYGDGCSVMFEAKFLSDISASTKYTPERDQLTRNLDAGLAAVGLDVGRFAYIFVTPKRFRDRPQTRLYGYKLTEFMDPRTGPAALERDLPHLRDEGVDFAELSRHIGWMTWEELCAVVMGAKAFRSPAFPREAFEQFFRERCLWPGSLGCEASAGQV